MNEQDIQPAETDRVPAALGFARAYYAGALLAARHRPDDAHIQLRAQEAWKEYKEAAEKHGCLSALAPSDFAQEQN